MVDVRFQQVFVYGVAAERAVMVIRKIDVTYIVVRVVLVYGE
jgi:hypothetical protein